MWLDVPLNVQGAVIETEELLPYHPEEDAGELPCAVPEDTVKQILEKIKTASRPVLFVGNGVRLSGAIREFHVLAEHLGIPVVTGMSSVDAMETDHPLYDGRKRGDRGPGGKLCSPEL